MSRIRIGTSGFHYAQWRGPFYPEALSTNRWLAYYAQRFDTVEINNSFYRLPSEETMEKWHAETPRGFCFAVKASRFLTHVKHLREPEEPITRLLTRIAPLGKKQGPMLFQLPPRWGRDAERLQAFFDVWPREIPAVFELRDPTWLHDEVYRVLAKNNAAFCIYELAGFQAPLEITADFTYIRLHGPETVKYAGRYSQRALEGWAKRIQDWKRLKTIYVYFDNDQAGYAAMNALELKSLVA